MEKVGKIEPVIMLYHEALNIDMKGHSIAYNVKFKEDGVTPRIKRIILKDLSDDIDDIGKVIYTKFRINRYMIMTRYQAFVEALNHEILHDILLEFIDEKASVMLDNERFTALDTIILESYIKEFNKW